MHLGLSADDVLTTTRAVRKRLDFDRPVEREVILDALQIALQAPTGSNAQGWHWLFVEDPETKAALGELYRTNFEAYKQYSRTYPDGDLRAAQRDRVRSSADYLADNWERVPVLLIPLIEGRLDNASVFQGASAWGSLLPAVWSFMLALRERGLGSAWTTLHLPDERKAADLLGIPFDRFTQGGLFPIAYTIGTDFKPATRLPTDGIVHWNRW
jgi:nitroreductase